mmetsp:Transcript_18712/g.43496  ORF Transcript_18712/g.43496 Transcript_18712/m.43496 type:complete len:228 (+) Transcript_18712:1374-2057(+)
MDLSMQDLVVTLFLELVSQSLDLLQVLVALAAQLCAFLCQRVQSLQHFGTGITAAAASCSLRCCLCIELRLQLLDLGLVLALQLLHFSRVRVFQRRCGLFLRFLRSFLLLSQLCLHLFKCLSVFGIELLLQGCHGFLLLGFQQCLAFCLNLCLQGLLGGLLLRLQLCLHRCHGFLLLGLKLFPFLRFLRQSLLLSRLLGCLLGFQFGLQGFDLVVELGLLLLLSLLR